MKGGLPLALPQGLRYLVPAALALVCLLQLQLLALALALGELVPGELLNQHAKRLLPRGGVVVLACTRRRP